MKKDNPSFIRKEFKDIDKKSDQKNLARMSEENLSLDRLNIYMDIDQRQALSNGGITLTMVIDNTSGRDTSIENPLDSLQILIQDEEGWPVRLPVSTPPRILINAPALDIIRPYKIVKVESTTRSGLMEQVNDEELRLKAGEVYQITLLLDQIQAGKKGDLRVSHQTIPLPAGKYKLNLNLPLLKPDGSDYRICESGYTEVELVDE